LGTQGHKVETFELVFQQCWHFSMEKAHDGYMLTALHIMFHVHLIYKM